VVTSNTSGTIAASRAFVTPHRIFQDDDGLTWTAWDVIPAWGNRRQGERRTGNSGPPAGLKERRNRDRRVTPGIRIALSPHLTRGWLAFESGTSRKRLVPIPRDWDSLPERDLRALLHEAEQVGAKRKRLIE
jgi:hypothetical protein